MCYLKLEPHKCVQILCLQEAAAQVEKIVGGKGLDVLINNAGTSEDLVPPLDT